MFYKIDRHSPCMVEYPLKKGLCIAAAKAVTVIVSGGAPRCVSLSRHKTGVNSVSKFVYHLIISL